MRRWAHSLLCGNVVRNALRTVKAHGRFAQRCCLVAPNLSETGSKPRFAATRSTTGPLARIARVHNGPLDQGVIPGHSGLVPGAHCAPGSETLHPLASPNRLPPKIQRGARRALIRHVVPGHGMRLAPRRQCLPQATARAWPERTRCRKHCSRTRCCRSVSAAVSLTSSEGPCRFSAECATYPRLPLPPPALSALDEAAGGILGLSPSPPATPPAPPLDAPCANVQRAPLRHLPCAKYLHGRMPGLELAEPLGSLLPRLRHGGEASPKPDASVLSSFFCFLRLSADAFPSAGELPAPHRASSTVCRRALPAAAPCPAASPPLRRSVGASLGCPG